jgi:hypothetical protein
MGKTVAPSKFAEWEGLDRISEVVHRMHCIYREISKDDFGIDGEIEVVTEKKDGSGYETAGGIIKVQSKSGRSYIRQNTATHFTTSVKKEDLETWNSANYPVIFIVYHPDDNILYWKDIKAYIRTTPKIFQTPLQIKFDKAKDKFDEGCYTALCSLAAISPPPVSYKQREQLFSNLLWVKRPPFVLTCADTSFERYQDIRGQVDGFVPPFCLKSGSLYTLADLRDPQCSLRPFCNEKTIRDINATEWTKDDSNARDYIFLLNQLLRSHLYRSKLSYNRTYNRYYFPRQDDKSLDFKRSWSNIRTKRAGQSRIVVKHYKYGHDVFWRHLAVQLTFMRLGENLQGLYLQVLPKYFFTTDGQTPFDNTKVGAYTTKIKAVERNSHVLNHVLFWIDVLSQGATSIDLQLGYKTIMVIEKEPLTGIAPFSIVSDPAIYEEISETVQPALFGEETDDEDYYI